MTPRDEVLGRIRTALGTGSGGTRPPAPGADGVPRGYRTSAGPGSAALAGLLAARLRDYGASVQHATSADVTEMVGRTLAERGARRVVVPAGLGLGELTGVTLVADDGLSPAELDAVDGVITGAALAIAETGTIVLDGGPGQGRRAVSLVPDYHLCLLEAARIVGIVPEALPRLPPGRPLTWISGPSATSDIELDRVQGVHGPRTLSVIIVAG